MGTGVACYRLGNAWTGGGRLPAVCDICPQPIQGEYSTPARAFLGWTAGCIGTRAFLVPAGGPSTARRDCCAYLCRRSLLRICARPDDYPAAAPPRTGKVAPATATPIPPWRKWPIGICPASLRPLITKMAIASHQPQMRRQKQPMAADTWSFWRFLSVNGSRWKCLEVVNWWAVGDSDCSANFDSSKT